MSKTKKEVPKRSVVVLYCQRSIKPGAEKELVNLDPDGAVMRAVMMPCSSKVQVADMLKLLADGADGVEVVACPEGSCGFLVGSRRAEKRVTRAGDLLAMAGLKRERVGITRATGQSAADLAALAAARIAAATT